MMFIQHNLLAENANRQLNVSSKRNAKTTEKLSSGYRINRAADDAAGLSISEKMRRQIRGLHQTVDNISEGVGYVQTAEGALNEVHDMLQRMNELAVKAANGTNTEEDRAYIDSEVQALKDEMDRIFRTTTFNERKIWEPGDRKLLGYRTVEAVDDRNTYNSLAVTNKNYAVLPGGNRHLSTTSYGTPYSVYYGGYFHVNADVQNGVNISWTGYNGQQYETQYIDWDTLKAQDYSFEISDYFDKDKYPELFDGSQPVFTHKMAFSPSETATIDDIAYCLNGRTMDADTRVPMRGTWENTVSGNQNFTIENVLLYYPAAYASLKNTGTAGNGHNFDAADDDFLEPSLQGTTNLTTHPQYSTVPTARNDSTGWQFSFEMEGIGSVKGTCDNIKYWSNDTTDDHEKIWWNWYYEYDQHGTVIRQEKRQVVRTVNGTLAGLMDTLTGDENAGTPGVLNGKNQGCNDGPGGTIIMNFNLTADSGFQYTGANGTAVNNSVDVGTFALRIPVSSTDTEESILTKVKEALNDKSILDFATHNTDSVSLYSVYPRYKGINAPIYGGICGFYVQAGTEGGQHISVQYESLSTLALGIGDTNTLTQESSGKAIDEIKGALQMVSEQRSTFGAYQNRIEHARNINANVEENTQAAESRIRDSDVADLMMEYSINNILMQAGTSMLTQANQSSQSILELLQ